MGVKEFLVNLGSKYSTGDTSKCHKYNLFDLFDPVPEE